MTLGVTDPDFPHPILRIDSNVECGTPRYDGVESLGVLGILIYAIATPLFWIALLYNNRNRLNSFGISQQLGFFYICYKDKNTSSISYLWDVIETIRKLMLGSLVVFVEPGSTTQLGFFFLVCLLALVAHLHVKPFKANLDNTLQGNALFAIVVTIFFAIFKRADRNAATAAEDDGKMSSFMYLVLIINILVVVTTIGSLVLLTRKIRILVPKIMSAVRRKSSMSSISSITKSDISSLTNTKQAGKHWRALTATKQAKPLGGEEQPAPSKAMESLNAHNEMKEQLRVGKMMAIEFSSSEDEDSGDEEAATPTSTNTQTRDTPRTKSGQPIS